MSASGGKQYVSAAQICAALGGRWTRGHHGSAKCPAHDDSTPSLAISETKDRRPLVKCFAGCSQEDVIAALRARGLWWAGDCEFDRSGAVAPAYDRQRDNSARVKRQRAIDLWDQSRPIKGTHAEGYLRARGIRLPLSDQLRFNASVYHTDSEKHFPCMVARLADSRGICSVQRTYLDYRGPRKAFAEKSKLCLGSMFGSAVRLREPKFGALGIAEGIETALSAMQIYSMPVWATCGSERLTKIEIPDGIAHLAIFGDSKPKERECAYRAAEFWESKGYAVELYFPDAHFQAGDGADFNNCIEAARI